MMLCRILLSSWVEVATVPQNLEAVLEAGGVWASKGYNVVYRSGPDAKSMQVFGEIMKYLRECESDDQVLGDRCQRLLSKPADAGHGDNHLDSTQLGTTTYMLTIWKD